LPGLIDGTIGATICISEPDGMYVRRLRTGRTTARRIMADHRRKCWISFGDQDLTGAIAHLLLAKTAPRTGPSPKDPISLFLVP
jgi:alkylation response protein AidB-like acyl-CoA dehydrogenase